MKQQDFQTMTREEMLAELPTRIEAQKLWLSQSVEKPARGVRGTIHFMPDRGHWFRIYHEDKSYTDYDLNHYDLQVEIVGNDASFFENKVTGKNTLDYPNRSGSQRNEHTE